jgi:ribosomal protein S18 acetylase RimI-like enzyme
MELINIIPSESKLWEQAWRLYTESFPEHERRRISSHARAVEDPNFQTKVVIENGNLLAILFYWTLGDDRIYIEHLAVNPQMRGRNIGSTILRNFMAQNPDGTMIVEAGAPSDETSRRRAAFYTKAGFIDTGFVYNHPSYCKNGLRHDLSVLSRPAPISEEEFAQFVDFLHGKVLRYID